MSDNENKGQNPRVFISYSWDSPEHKLWVESFAQELRKSGIDARLDAWRDESQSIDDFMMVELERADFVLAVCTPQFKQKIVENAEGRATASGFEIGTAAALRRMGGKDVIPVLKAGKWTEAAPSSLLSYRYYDFTKGDVSEEFTQLRDRLLGHIRRPPELGKAVGPSAAPQLPDIFSEGSTPKPQPTSAPRPAQEFARSGPPTQQHQPVASAPSKTGYSKGKVWGTVGAIVAGLVVLWNIIPDGGHPDTNVVLGPEGSAVDEFASSSAAAQTNPVGEDSALDFSGADEPGNADDIDMVALLETLREVTDSAPEQSTVSDIPAEDRWTFISGSGGCGIEKEVAAGSWVQLVYAPSDDAYTFGTADPAWGEYAQTDVLYEAGFAFQFDDDTSTHFVADVVGYDYDGIPGAFTFVGEDVVEYLASYYYLNVYRNIDPYLEHPIMSFDLAGSTEAAEQLLGCVQRL